MIAPKGSLRMFDEIMPLYTQHAMDGTQLHTLVDAVRLGSGLCAANIIMPDGTTVKLKVMATDAENSINNANYRSH